MNPCVDPSGADILNRARTLLQQNSSDEALTLLQSYVSTDPHSSEAFELMAVAYSQKGMVNEGIEALISAVNLNPSNVSSRVNLGVALQRAGRTAEAIQHFQAALKVDPSNAKSLAAVAELAGSSPQPLTSQSSPIADDTGAWNPLNTFKVIVDPRAFFRKHRDQTKSLGLFFFVIIWAMISGIINFATMTTSGWSQVQPGGTIGFFAVATLIGLPIVLGFLIVGIYILTGFSHLFVLMFGDRAQFAGTLRSIIYSYSPVILAVIISNLLFLVTYSAEMRNIVCIIGLIASFCLLIIAYQEIHDLSLGKSIAAALIPVVITIAFAVTLAAAVSSLRSSIQKIDL